MDLHDLRKFLKQNFSRAEVYDTQWEYRRNMLSRWNVHNEQVLRMMKKAVLVPPNRGYSAVYHRKYLRYSG